MYLSRYDDRYRVFQYNGVNSKTHKIIAELINKGIIQSKYITKYIMKTVLVN